MCARFRLGLIFIFAMLSLLLLSCSHRQPATRQGREKWNLDMLYGSYQSFGHTNASWDKDAQEALSNFAQTKTASDDEKELFASLAGYDAESAVKAGCDDPMIRYLYVKFSPAATSKTSAEREELYRTAANYLEGSTYLPIGKFYANADAAQFLWRNRDSKMWNEVWNFRNTAVNDLVQAVQDKTLPEAEAFQAADTLFQLLSRNASQLTNAYNQIESAMASAGIRSATPDFIKAVFYNTYAWQARGHGISDQVSQQSWRLFFERLGDAERALNKAYSRDPLDPEIPTEMISIALGQQKERPVMEKWFQRAMKADPKNYQACPAKLNYLTPQWYGSRDDMLAFGRECVANTNWGGRVPLTLVDAHRAFYRSLSQADRAGYWVYRDVWPDIRASYERFAQANPDETRFRYPYAWYAFSCGQPNAFLEQIKIIRQNEDEVRCNYFGGKEAFARMEAYASGKEMPTNEESK